MNLVKRCRYGLMIYNQLDKWVGKSFSEYGEFSESEVQLFKKTIVNGDVVLDIGANIGAHTVALSRIVGERGLVLGFEPERTNYYTLAGNVAINNLKNTRVYQMAVADESGEISIPELDFEKTTNFGGLELSKKGTYDRSYSVPMTTVDKLNLKKLNFMKIDVEGMEREVLLGAEKSIKQFRPILYAESDRPEKSEDLISLLKSYGYKIFRHTAPMFNPTNFFFETKNHFQQNVDGKEVNIVSINLFCHHKDLRCPVDVSLFRMQEL
jgi:FkbM family methyltransferase